MLEERENLTHIELRCNFTESWKTVLGPKATPGVFMPNELIPEWNLYEDED